MFRKAVNFHRSYRETKDAVVERSVTLIETRSRTYYFFIFFALNLLAWWILIRTPIGPVEAYQHYGFMPVPAVFVISYFAIFLGSKVIFKPTREEIEDDTSPFALFSACPRREYRALLSLALSVLHTVVFFGYYIGKDPKLLDALGGKTS